MSARSRGRVELENPFPLDFEVIDEACPSGVILVPTMACGLFHWTNANRFQAEVPRHVTVEKLMRSKNCSACHEEEAML